MAIRKLVQGTVEEASTLVSLTSALFAATVEHARSLKSDGDVESLISKVVSLSDSKNVLSLADLSEVTNIGEEVTASTETAAPTPDVEYVFEELKGLGVVPDTRSDPKAYLMFAPKERMGKISKYLLKDYKIGPAGSWDHKYLPVTLMFDGGTIIKIKVLPKKGSVSWTTRN